MTAHFSAENRARAEALVALYPQSRSALVPLCHLAQAQDGWLCAEAMEEIAELCGTTPAEVYGTATFYDMLHTERVGRHVIAICTNIACLLAGAYELVEHAERRLGVRCGQTTEDGEFTLEEAECLAGCDAAPCVQVNHRFVAAGDAASFDAPPVARIFSGDTFIHCECSRIESICASKMARQFPAASFSSRSKR